MRHLGHPTSTMDVASGLLEYLRASSWLLSDDTHELGGDVGDTVADLPGDSTLGFTLGGERFRRNPEDSKLNSKRFHTSLALLYTRN